MTAIKHGLLAIAMALPALLCGAASGEPVAKADTGTIVGVVRFTGKVPPPQDIWTTENSLVRHSDLVVDTESKGLRDVVTVLENAPVQPPAKKAPMVAVDQRDMIFIPRVIAVQHGQTVRFDNSDACNHSVTANSTVKANQFNLFVLPNRPYDHAFEAQKHPVQIGCSLHAWMRAYVFVVPHPWFAISDAQGRFRIENVPPGKYTIWLRHPDTGKQERRDTEVKAGQTSEVVVEWEKTGN